MEDWTGGGIWPAWIQPFSRTWDRFDFPAQGVFETGEGRRLRWTAWGQLAAMLLRQRVFADVFSVSGQIL
jgi:hypothetical protein